ncbi:MAG: YhbY family RNA-binding protein [Gammaproteobacteria bacterium]|nr:YhbY family RNA-binding protein [Gammaproteobacteria bacterium]
MTNVKTSLDLKPNDIREMKGRLHHLKPTVILGNKGLTDEVLNEINNELNHKELIKIRTIANGSEELMTIAEEICAKTKAILIQTIGHIIAIYRKNLQVEE